MGEVVSIINGQPIIQNARITSASKPEISVIPDWMNHNPQAKSAVDHMKANGWQIYTFKCGEVCARHPRVLWHQWMSLTSAVNIQRALNEAVFRVEGEFAL